jgi:FAD/FMN-containing dehydrogenase
MVGDSHSWSPLGVTNDYLICTRRFNKILDIRTDPPRITVEPGVTVGQTLRAFMQNGVCFPMNVDLPTLTIGGAVAVGANGFSRRWGTYSEFVEEVELVTGTGEIRTVRKDRDGNLWRAVACSLGSLVFLRGSLWHSSQSSRYESLIASSTCIRRWMTSLRYLRTMITFSISDSRSTGR